MRLGHRHKWKVKQTRTIAHYIQYIAHSSDMPFKHTTEILYECVDCGKLKTETMKGKWQL